MNPSNRNTAVKITICFPLFFLTLVSSGQDTRIAEAANRTVEMTLVQADDLAPVAWPKEEITLRHDSTIVSGGANVYTLLRANGIAPDSEAFALVYDLNLGLKDANNIAAGTSLALPSVTGSSGALEFLKGRQLVELTLDPGIRSVLNERIDSLQAALPQIGQLSPGADVLAQIKELITWFQQIERRLKRRTAPPLRQASLIQLNEEAGLLSSLLPDALQRHRDLSS